jgi:hypothetical protein
MVHLIWLICFLFISCSSLFSYELAIVSMFKNEGNYLKEWIEYHRMVGVEHFWLYNNGSTDNFSEVLQPYIKEGLVDLFYWPKLEGEATHVPAQIRAFKDGLRRARGNTKWVAALDTDEFLLPFKEKTIPECLEKHFPRAVAVYVNWRNFGTGGVTIPQGDPILFRLTACSFKSHTRNWVGKSIVRPEYVLIDQIWYVHHFVLPPNTLYVNGDGEPMERVLNDLKTDGKSHYKYLCINHYALRDEKFFKDERLAKLDRGFKDKTLLLECYEAFSLVRDYTIINFIRDKHPDMYEKFWKNYE